MLLIDPIPKKIVRARWLRSMVETDEPGRDFFFGLMAACHDDRPKSLPGESPSWEAPNLWLFYVIPQ